MNSIFKIFTRYKDCQNNTLYLYSSNKDGAVRQSFSSLDSATEAAKRAASIEIDKDFYVFKAIRCIKASKPEVAVTDIAESPNADR